jgi:hypothetical protein
VNDRWGHTEEMLAVLIEMIDGFRLMWLRANTREGTRLPDPVKVPRPGSKKEPAAPTVSWATFAARMKG